MSETSETGDNTAAEPKKTKKTTPTGAAKTTKASAEAAEDTAKTARKTPAPKRGGAGLPTIDASGLPAKIDQINAGDRDEIAALAAWPTNAKPPVSIDPLSDPYFVTVPEGVFLMGGVDKDANTIDGEGPVRPVHVSEFELTATHVTNAQFAKFVAETGYVTECEEIGWSYIFAGLLKGEARKEFMVGHSDDTAWWLGGRTINWRTPQGPGTSWEDLADHPVVHVTLRDAEACAKYYGGRLVTEAEWEKAARGGITYSRYPWGNEAIGTEGSNDWRANIWQGKFPVKNSLDDGYYATSPVTHFAPNAMGFYDMSGNVWDWTADWYSNAWHVNANPENRFDPKGPAQGETRVIRGGSYLCHDSYCNRYRIAARTSTPSNSSTGHLGFRIARSL